MSKVRKFYRLLTSFAKSKDFPLMMWNKAHEGGIFYGKS